MAFDFDKYIRELEERAEKNNIGKMIASGIGVGLSEESYLAVTALENVYVKLETVTRNAEKNAENLRKLRQKRELENLKNSLELGLVSEQEYYEKLKKYRDEHLSRGSEAWYKYTDEIVAYNKRLTEEAAQQQILMMKKIQSMEEELEQHLKGKNADWVTHNTIRFLGVNPDGSDMVVEKTTLEDFADEIDLLERYREAILGLKALGDVPDGIFSILGGMKVEKAVELAEELLGLSEADREKFLGGFEARNALAGQVAAQLNGIVNKEALEEAGVDVEAGFSAGFFESYQEKQAFVEELEEKFEQVPEGYYELGEKSAEAFGQGLEHKLVTVFEDARHSILSTVSDIALSMVTRTMDAVKNITENSNVYNTSYIFNSSKDTTTQQLAAANNAETLKRLRNGG